MSLRYYFYSIIIYTFFAGKECVNILAAIRPLMRLMKYIKASRIGRRIFYAYKNLYERVSDRMATDLSVNLG